MEDWVFQELPDDFRDTSSARASYKVKLDGFNSDFESALLKKIGLTCWQSVLDEDGQSPETYAKLRNHNSYNELVAQKLVDMKNNQVTITVNGDEIRMDQLGNVGDHKQFGVQVLQIRSCSQCAILESGVLRQPVRSRGVCVCVCVFMRALLRINSGKSFKWERLDFGTI
ncbi:squamosa promoter-binding-like protein 15 [Sorghum bicolor]|uniref:Uncharacterized protein n=1 Tax=Sorghum bicolor TaxID=4558 RepID=A0A194YRH2_SORBI|nr:squamosa promoter-binding-like protein 15 [Sorghum bicolor]KXG30430.1 hypothetical protein SORBI_3004G180000 [Sorghum bicolor]|eukprot:XP_002452281.2 squamosa promoter-binding-like protein 15 [Sorghum bicolor]